MVTIIPERVKNIWDAWNVRGAIIFSFLVQMILVLFAPSRKRSDNMLLQFFIWSAYLLADWAANFSMGLITNNIAGGNGGDDDANKETLMALWAPFVLLHLGGPDTITAFSLEDNQLWLRQVPGLLFQVAASAYVFVLSLPRNTMWVPTLLVFVAGLIKCFERTRALYIANNNLGAGNKSPSQSLLDDTSIEDEPGSDNPFEALLRRTFPYVEILLEKIYERHYTKAPVLRSRMGCLLRLVAFSSMVIALGVFSSIEKTRGSVMWDKVDVTITYTLFCGALLLEIVSCLMTATTSPRFIRMRSHSDGWSGCGKFSTFIRPWSRSISGHNLIRLYLSKCHDQPKKPYLCLKLMKFQERILDQIAYFLGGKEILELSKYKTKTPLQVELWLFISKGIKIESPKSGPRQDSTLKQRIHSMGEGRRRIEVVIDNIMHHIINPFLNSEEYPFGRTLTLLHTATTLCYADDNFAGELRRYSKLISDYMMYLFLMQPDMLSELHGIEGPWTQETMVDGSISCEFIDFFKQNGLTSRNHEEEACRCVLSRPHHYNSSPPYPTVLLLARSIAEDLKEFPSDLKWEAIANIWVQMLIFAAVHSRSSIHFKYLPKGGELISHVWIASLMWELEGNKLKRLTWQKHFRYDELNNSSADFSV
ncbi:hypothetical protein K1719_008760 [Acacia pycnantha]|nr:hypothetical protein K1719_008760 [Acacia pycnantha]